MTILSGFYLPCSLSSCSWSILPSIWYIEPEFSYLRNGLIALKNDKRFVVLLFYSYI